jgi:hypothetical protein
VRPYLPDELTRAIQDERLRKAAEQRLAAALTGPGQSSPPPTRRFTRLRLRRAPVGPDSGAEQ